MKKIISVQLADGCTASYALETNSSYALYDHGYTSVPQNANVYMVGGKSGLQQGIVQTTEATKAGEELLVDCYGFSYSSQPGDSGAPVYAMVSGERMLVAMHRGSLGVNKNGVPIETIMYKLGISFDY